MQQLLDDYQQYLQGLQGAELDRELQRVKAAQKAARADLARAKREWLGLRAERLKWQALHWLIVGNGQVSGAVVATVIAVAVLALWMILK